MTKLFKIFKISVYIAIVLILVPRIIYWQQEIVWKEQLEYGILCFVYSLALTAVNVYFYAYISKKYSWEFHPQKRLWIGALGAIGLTLIAFAFVRIAVSLGYYGKTFRGFLENEQLFSYLIALLIAIVVSLFLHAFHFYRALQDNKVKEQKIIAGTASAQFDALKNQLDPHFLFNSLNVLTSLIEESPDKAQKFTASLSKVYRYVLEQKNKDLVTVDEELAFAKTFVNLMKMRFEESIVFEVLEKSTNPEAKIVPLSLQLLLENAVKHNVVTAKKPLHIKVYEEKGMLCVSNNLQVKQVVKKSSGVGLRNIMQRYQILSDRKVVIQKTETDFSVRLPMLTKQLTLIKSQEDFIEDKRYQKAKARVEALKGFYGNALAYCIVIPLMAVLNYSTTSFPWVIFPALGWGFGLLMHGMEVYGYNPVLGKRWEERKMREYMEDKNF
ncbi:Pr2TM family membrane protein [Arenibacter sp. 6A1]|uniref:2TM domain-containing protein n=1 Tax=Arenibacter sp. 6A1 TaxID=2720391 RepID=UPI0014451196|nr:2TM domain-containing protein [Arenibacter sp. 6A1]NKI27197.1 Pr2TM family membrane protein [Arenibacter sp. 6A1]